jgi:hypothetical protein
MIMDSFFKLTLSIELKGSLPLVAQESKQAILLYIATEISELKPA